MTLLYLNSDNKESNSAEIPWDLYLEQEFPHVDILFPRVICPCILPFGMNSHYNYNLKATVVVQKKNLMLQTRTELAISKRNNKRK